MLFKWKDTFSVNVSDIDRQHKKLFEIGSRVYDIVSLDDNYDHYDEIMEILNELVDYTVYHFGFEEKLMEKYGYEDYEQHKMQHYFFIKKVEKMVKKDIDERQQEVMRDLIAFIADWISSHILKSDMKYKEFFNKNFVF